MRAERALKVFKERQTVHYCELPGGVGHKTVARLIALGLVEVVDPSIGRHSKEYAWRLVR